MVYYRERIRLKATWGNKNELLNPKVYKHWICIGRTDAEAEAPMLRSIWFEELTHWERSRCWERLMAEGEGGNRGWGGWMASLTQKSSLIAESVKNMPAMQETRVQLLGWKDPLEKEMATHSSILAWRIPWTRGAWQATIHRIERVRHDLATKPPPPPPPTQWTWVWANSGRQWRTGKPGVLQSMGCKESNTT